MNIDVTIYGYVFDGAVICTHCLAEGDPEDQPLLGYNISEWYDKDGLSCDRCGAYIVEPEPVVEVSDNLLEPLEPSFKAQHGREPEPGRDYDPDGSLCQDDHEYLTGTGRYSNDVPYNPLDDPESFESMNGRARPQHGPMCQCNSCCSCF